jgi:hypothetical protein
MGKVEERRRKVGKVEEKREKGDENGVDRPKF